MPREAHRPDLQGSYTAKALEHKSPRSPKCYIKTYRHFWNDALPTLQVKQPLRQPSWNPRSKAELCTSSWKTLGPRWEDSIRERMDFVYLTLHVVTFCYLGHGDWERCQRRPRGGALPVTVRRAPCIPTPVLGLLPPHSAHGYRKLSLFTATLSHTAMFCHS